MTAVAVEIAHEGGVLIIRLNRPDKKNALTNAMYQTMAQALREAGANPEVCAILFLGHPGIFCAGNDLADFVGASEGGALLALDYLVALVECEKPLLAAVDGAAIGLGTTLMFHCDLVYASPRALFQTPFVNLGLVPEAASSLLAPRIMGNARAFELLVMGEPFSVERAKEAGFVNFVVPSEELEKTALATAMSFAKRPREAVRLARKLLKGDVSEIKQRIHDEAVIFAERLKSQEAKAAFQAFLQK